MSLKDDSPYLAIGKANRYLVIEKRPDGEFILEGFKNRKEADKLASKYNQTGDFSYYVETWEKYVLGMPDFNMY